MALFEWGFVPHWADRDDGPEPVNARAETVAQSLMFGDSLRERRCVLPADGFYEWKAINKKKMPAWFHLKDTAPFGFAGIWDVWPGPAGRVFTVAILTTTPNDLTRQVHDRMPVILDPDAEAAWLDPKDDNPDKLMPRVGPYPADQRAMTDANPGPAQAAVRGPECLVQPAPAA